MFWQWFGDIFLSLYLTCSKGGIVVKWRPVVGLMNFAISRAQRVKMTWPPFDRSEIHCCLNAKGGVWWNAIFIFQTPYMLCGWRLSILASCSIPTRFLLGFSLKFLWHFIVVSGIVAREVGDWMGVMGLWWTWMDARTEAMRVNDEVYEVGQVVNHQCMRHKARHLVLLHLRLRNFVSLTKHIIL